MGNWKKPSDTTGFRENVIRQQERILELKSHELRNTSKEIIRPNMSSIIVEEDTRISYYQSVQAYAHLLVSYFDDEAKKVYKRCNRIISAFYFQIPKILPKKYKKICKDRGNDKNKDLRLFDLMMKMRYADKLFVEMNLLISRNDHLKSTIFGETGDDKYDEEEDE